MFVLSQSNETWNVVLPYGSEMLWLCLHKSPLQNGDAVTPSSTWCCSRKEVLLSLRWQTGLWEKTETGFWVLGRVKSHPGFQILCFQSLSMFFHLLNGVVSRNMFLGCDVSWWVAAVAVFPPPPQLHYSSLNFSCVSFPHGFVFSSVLQDLCASSLFLSFRFPLLFPVAAFWFCPHFFPLVIQAATREGSRVGWLQ